MSQLDGNTGLRKTPDGCNDARNGGLTVVIPDSQASGRDPTGGFDGSCLDEDHGGARHRQAAEVNHVPVGRQAVFGGVLAHGGDENAIR
jgi:hypothetical protein